MRVLFTTLRNTGHFQPLVPVIDACRRRGHEVGVAAPADLADRVAATGATFFPVGHPGDAGLGPIWARLKATSPEEGKRIVIEEIFAGACVRFALPDLLSTLEGFRPAVIVREAQEYGGLLAAEKHGLPCVRVSISVGQGEADVFRLAVASLDTHRVELGLAPDPSGRRFAEEPSFTQIPPSFEEPGGPMAFRFRLPRREAAPLPDWWGGSRAPLVYVTLGTVTAGMDTSRGSFRTVLDAVAGLPLRVLLTTGSELGADVLGEVPPNVHVERFVPQDDVLPHAAAIVCHGGTGTVLGALGAGVPLVVTPMFADQPVNAGRVAATGAGLSLEQRTFTSAAIREALSRVVEEPPFRLAAARMAAEIGGLPLVDDAALELERLGARVT